MALVITIIILLILSGITIAAISSKNGILSKANEAYEKGKEAEKDEKDKLNFFEQLIANLGSTEKEENEDKKENKETFDKEAKINKPKIEDGMIPVKYDKNNKKWLKADEQNNGKDWFDYSKENKRWANIVTVKESVREKYKNAEVGTEISMDDITTMFVWIPRYSYNIIEQGKIDISFLQNDTNKEENGNETNKFVHPGFEFNGKQLSGFWFAKFEASGINENNQMFGNTQSAPNDSESKIIIKPNVTSWRYISIGESQYQCLKMKEDNSMYGLGNKETHLMRNSEWGAVAYLCYSDYGTAPLQNSCGSRTGTNCYNIITGAGPNMGQRGPNNGEYEYNENTFIQEHSYNTESGVLASTTGNETGIYDMNGGAAEQVAMYLDNGNANITANGNSSKVQFFNNNRIENQYNSIWEAYEVSEEENNNEIQIINEDGTTETLTQKLLWDKEKVDKKYQEVRLRLTKSIFDLMAKHKGIGINEISSEFSAYLPYSKGESKNWGWFKNYEQSLTGTQNYAVAWDGDYILIGHALYNFMTRGGYFYNSDASGVFYTYITKGEANSGNTFRPVML